MNLNFPPKILKSFSTSQFCSLINSSPFPNWKEGSRRIENKRIFFFVISNSRKNQFLFSGNPVSLSRTPFVDCGSFSPAKNFSSIFILRNQFSFNPGIKMGSLSSRHRRKAPAKENSTPSVSFPVFLFSHILIFFSYLSLSLFLILVFFVFQCENEHEKIAEKNTIGFASSDFS